jgi:hypothetical protein
MAEGTARFWTGLALGVALGAGAAWLAMARPWQASPAVAAAPAIDAGQAEPVGATPGKKKKRRGGGRAGASGDQGGVYDEAVAPVLTAADRQIVTRGPSIVVPRRSIDMGDGSDARPLDGGEINEVIRRSSGPVLACIEDARAGASLSGEVKLVMLVGGDGRVGKVRVSAPRWLVERGFADCATAAVRRWTFPATGAPTLVDAPYHID